MNERLLSMKRFAALILLAVLSVISVGKIPPHGTDRPVCIKNGSNYVCGPTPDDLLGI